MQCLLDVLRGQRISDSLEESDWIAAFHLAELEHVLPMFAHRLRQTKQSMPVALNDTIAQVERQTALDSFWWASELKGLLAAFAADDMDVIALKGPFLAERIYGAVARRTCRDLDLLVRRHDLLRAEHLLETVGFASAGRSDDYHRSWIRGSTGVELHFDVENPLAFNFDVDGAWRRARPTTFLGVHVWQLEPSDELVFLCLHGVRHRFERLSLALDISLMLASYADQLKPHLQLRPKLAPLANLVALGYLIAARLCGDREGGIPIQVDIRVENHMRTLADRIWSELLHKPSPKLDWRSQHRFFLETESNLTGYLLRAIRHTCILVVRAIDKDFQFAERFGLRQTWQVRLLRPLRLLLRA